MVSSRSVLFFLLVVLLSKISWYDFRALDDRGLLEFNLRFFFLIQASLCLPVFLACALLKATLYSTVSAVFLTFLIYTVATGIIFGNSIVYILQEIIKYLLIPASFALTRSIRSSVEDRQVLSSLFSISACMIILRFIFFLVITGGSDINYGTPQDIFPIIYSLGLAVQGSFYVGLSSFVALSILVGVGDKRTVIALILLNFVFFLFISLVRRQKLVAQLFLVPIGLMGAVYLLVASGDLQNSRLFRKDYAFELSEQSRRVAEVQIVVSELRENPELFIIGKGGGVSLDLPSYVIAKSSEDVHSLHNTLAAMIYRHGLLGLFVYIYLAIWGVRWAYKNLGRGTNVLLAYVFIFYKISAFLSSFLIYGFIDDVIIGTLMGLIDRRSRLDRLDTLTGVRDKA